MGAPGFLRRSLAWLIDVPIVVLPALVLTGALVLALDSSNPPPSSQPRETEIQHFAAYPVLALAMAGGFALLWRLGWSPGMALLHIRPLGIQDELPPRMNASLVRGLLTALP